MDRVHFQIWETFASWVGFRVYMMYNLLLACYVRLIYLLLNLFLFSQLVRAPRILPPTISLHHFFWLTFKIFSSKHQCNRWGKCQKVNHETDFANLWSHWKFYFNQDLIMNLLNNLQSAEGIEGKNEGFSLDYTWSNCCRRFWMI